MPTAVQPTISAEFAATYRDILVERIEFETNSTSRTIAAIPEDKKSYKPAEDSRTAWQLATHLAVSEIWFLSGIVDANFNWTGETPDPANTIAELVQWYKQNLKAVSAKLRALTPEQLAQPVDFFGIQKLPASLYLLWAHEHTVHHRGQLTAYLRPMGAKVPDIYGGSFDEPFTGQ